MDDVSWGSSFNFFFLFQPLYKRVYFAQFHFILINMFIYEFSMYNKNIPLDNVFCPSDPKIVFIHDNSLFWLHLRS